MLRPPPRNPGTVWPAKSSTASAGNYTRSQKYREGQEDQLGALGIVINAIVLWNTRYIDAAVSAQRANGVLVGDEDAAHLSPLGHAHLNELGRYTFPTATPDANLRQLRNPDIELR